MEKVVIGNATLYHADYMARMYVNFLPGGKYA